MGKKIGFFKRAFKFYLILGIIVVIFLPPFARYQELRYKNKKLEERLESLKEENERLTEEKRLLETDINYVEKMAREKMGLIRGDEVIYKVVPAGGRTAGAEVAPPDAKAEVKADAPGQAGKKTSSPKTKTSATIAQSSDGKKSTRAKAAATRPAAGAVCMP